MVDITAVEKLKIKEFREKVDLNLGDDFTGSDWNLIRWIRARNSNIDAAIEMFRNHLKWREENGIDEILTLALDPYFSQNFPHWLNGVDRKGRPVLCIPMGDWDVRKVVQDGRVDDFKVFINRLFERVMECIRKNNARRSGDDEEPVTQFCCIVNWEGFTGRQTASLKAIQTLLNVTMVYEAHYPEILGQAFFINTNPFFQIFFNLLKPILAQRTLSKIECYGVNRSQWEPVVRSVVEEHQLPRQFGG